MGQRYDFFLNRPTFFKETGSPSLISKKEEPVYVLFLVHLSIHAMSSESYVYEFSNGVEYRCLIFETCQWDNLHTIRTSVCHASSRQDDKQVWFTQRHLLLCFVMLLYKSFYLQEVCSTIIYLPTAKFTLDKCIAAVSKMQYKVCLKSISVTVVGQSAIMSCRINTKISGAHLLKDEAEGLQLRHQRFRVQA